MAIAQCFVQKQVNRMLVTAFYEGWLNMNFDAERERILQEMAGITVMRRGKLTKQINRVKRVDGSVRQSRPYLKLQAWRNGRNQSQRMAGEQVAQVTRDMKACARFRALTNEYIAVGEQEADAKLGEISRRQRATGSSAERPISSR